MITIADGNGHPTNPTGWYGGTHEDNETEYFPTTPKGQEWDLEGMYVDGTKLTLVGGYNFINGASLSTAPTTILRPGDIFIDVDGDVKYTTAQIGSTPLGTSPVANSFGYDYVLKFNYGSTAATTTYSVFSINGSSEVLLPTVVPSSSPWRYSSGGTGLAGFADQAIQFGLLDSTTVGALTTFGSGTGSMPSVGLLGYLGNDNHYFLSVDLSFLPATSLATIHYTMECGNDNLMGQTAIVGVPDHGATAVLMLLGLAGLVRFRARRS